MMYLNHFHPLSHTPTTYLTETYDVFKFSIVCKMQIQRLDLTETYDVFK